MHKCNDHNVSDMGMSHIKPYRRMYCHDCEREFTGMWQNGELKEYGGKLTSVF